MDLGEDALAVSIFDPLAREDSRYEPDAVRARLAFRAANWPPPERDAARSERLTRSEAAILVWWMFPEIREARVASGVIASDVISRRDTRALSRALALGLLQVDREKHRANPDAPLTVSAAARLLLRLAAFLRPSGADLPCSARGRSGAEAVRAAQECGLLEDSVAVISGPVFTRALDQVRAVASAVAPPAGPDR
jgi:hypothetical protein